jgi:hypothetical protein
VETNIVDANNAHTVTDKGVRLRKRIPSKGLIKLHIGGSRRIRRSEKSYAPI